jgi:hypothetical protein
MRLATALLALLFGLVFGLLWGTGNDDTGIACPTPTATTSARVFPSGQVGNGGCP